MSMVSSTSTTRSATPSASRCSGSLRRGSQASLARSTPLDGLAAMSSSCCSTRSASTPDPSSLPSASWLQLARLPTPIPRRRAQDRPLVHLRYRIGPRIRCADPHPRPARQGAQPRDRGRRNRTTITTPNPPRRGLRHRPGIPPRTSTRDRSHRAASQQDRGQQPHTDSRDLAAAIALGQRLSGSTRVSRPVRRLLLLLRKAKRTALLAEPSVVRRGHAITERPHGTLVTVR